VSSPRIGWSGVGQFAPPRHGRACVAHSLPPPRITREIALATLRGRPWRIVCTLSGLREAALVGLGVTVVVAALIPPGLAEVADSGGLPDLDRVDFRPARGQLENARTGPPLAAAILATIIGLQ
jgi:hypothetical protein